jgi:hypothetical protein
MLYVAVALAVYAWTVADLLQRDGPGSARETLAAVLGCAVVAAFWPIALAWRFLLGSGSGGRPAASVRALRYLARALSTRGPLPSGGARR